MNFNTVLESGATMRVFLKSSIDQHPGEYLINAMLQTVENAPQNPPASVVEIQALPEVTISLELLQSSGDPQCIVCMNMFEIGDVCRELHCGHLYHPNCIFQWLGLHNTCPKCRYEMKTDNEIYEKKKGN